MYAAADDLVARFGIDELTAIAPSDMPGEFDADRVNTSIEDATAEINSYLAARYDLPVETNKQLTSAACDIARYQLYDQEATEQVEKRYKQRIAWLKDLTAGRATLGIAESTATSGKVAVSRTLSDRKFTRDTLANF